MADSGHNQGKDNEQQTREIHWSVQLETLIAREAEKCRGLAWIHQRAELHQNYRNNIIQIPVIVSRALFKNFFGKIKSICIVYNR
jgi:hypothetical protein